MESKTKRGSQKADTTPEDDHLPLRQKYILRSLQGAGWKDFVSSPRKTGAIRHFGGAPLPNTTTTTSPGESRGSSPAVPSASSCTLRDSEGG